eukprot:736141_1
MPNNGQNDALRNVSVSKLHSSRFVRLFQIAVRVKGIGFETDSISWKDIHRNALQWSVASKSHGKILSITYYTNASVKEVTLHFDRNTETVRECTQIIELQPNNNHKMNKITIKMVIAGNLNKSYRKMKGFLFGTQRLSRRFCHFSLQLVDGKKGGDLNEKIIKQSHPNNLSSQRCNEVMHNLHKYKADLQGMLRYDELNVCGERNVFCYSAIKELIPSNDDDHCDELHVSLIQLMLVRNGLLIHPIPDHDSLLPILQHKIVWKEYGIKSFIDHKWKLPREDDPVLQKRVINENTQYSQKRFKLNITIIIKDDAKEPHMYDIGMENAIVRVVNQSLKKLKKQSAINTEFMYSYHEQRVENTITTHVPIIAECLANILSRSNRLQSVRDGILNSDTRNEYGWCPPNNKLQWILHDRMIENLNIGDKVDMLYNTQQQQDDDDEIKENTTKEIAAIDNSPREDNAMSDLCGLSMQNEEESDDAMIDDVADDKSDFEEMLEETNEDGVMDVDTQNTDATDASQIDDYDFDSIMRQIDETLADIGSQ